MSMDDETPPTGRPTPTGGMPPTEPGRPTGPGLPTEPIRPSQIGTEPIPERVRQPIVVPHPVSTIAGLPRPLALAVLVALVAALGLGFFIGRATGGGDEISPAAAKSGRRGDCGRALTLSLQVGELQKQALVNRTEATQALALGDEVKFQELGAGLEAISAAIQEAESQLASAVERCRSGGGGKKGKGGAGGDKGGGKGNA